MSNDTFHHANAALPLLSLCPLLVDLSDENPLDKYRK